MHSTQRSKGAGVLLAHDVLAYDDLRTGRLVIPFRADTAHRPRLSLRLPEAGSRPPGRARVPRVGEGRGRCARLDQVAPRACAARQEDARMTGAAMLSIITLG